MLKKHIITALLAAAALLAAGSPYAATPVQTNEQVSDKGIRHARPLSPTLSRAAGEGANESPHEILVNGMGLSKTSVFEVPTPVVYHYSVVPPGQSKLLPRAYPGAPPQISHDIADFLPITRENNLCIACHNQPDLWGKKLEAGSATPIPPSHFTDLRNAPGKVTDHLINARYNCNQCHVPQTDAPPLVENTFSAKRAR